MSAKFTRKELDNMVLAELEQAPKEVQSQRQSVGLRGLLNHIRQSKAGTSPEPTPGQPPIVQQPPVGEGMSAMRQKGTLGVGELGAEGEV